MARILIIEDDEALKNELAHLLELSGYEAVLEDKYAQAAERAVRHDPDCVVIDLKLPGADGLQICRELRKISSVPIIILTSSDKEFDEVMAMNLGADDYVTKPYRPAVLLARIQSLIRRQQGSNGASNAELRIKGLSLHLDSGSAEYAGSSAELTRNELKILALLMRQPDVILSRQEIMEELWESDAFIDDNTLTVNINRLRKKLIDLGLPAACIETRRGIGYCLCTDAL